MSKKGFIAIICIALSIILLTPLLGAAEGPQGHDGPLGGGNETPSAGFVTIVTPDGQLYRDIAVDSPETLAAQSGVADQTYQIVRFVPDNEEAYPYLYPEREWKMMFGTVQQEEERPDWFTDEISEQAWAAFDAWKTEIYSIFDYEAVRSLSIQDTIVLSPAADYVPTDEDMEAFRAYVRKEDTGTDTLVYLQDGRCYP